MWYFCQPASKTAVWWLVRVNLHPLYAFPAVHLPSDKKCSKFWPSWLKSLGVLWRNVNLNSNYGWRKQVSLVNKLWQARVNRKVCFPIISAFIYMYLIYIANLTAEGPLSKRECNLYKRGLALLWKTNFPLAPVLKIDSRAHLKDWSLELIWVSYQGDPLLLLFNSKICL